MYHRILQPDFALLRESDGFSLIEEQAALARERTADGQSATSAKVPSPTFSIPPAVERALASLRPSWHSLLHGGQRYIIKVGLSTGRAEKRERNQAV